MKRIKHLEEKYLKKNVPQFKIGDTVVVYVKIQEEGKTRIQVFEGVAMKRKGRGLRSTFTVRRVSYGEGVERTFLLHSPIVDRVEVKKKGSVRRAKLYYLRKRKGKKSKVAERSERETLSPGAKPVENAPVREEGA